MREYTFKTTDKEDAEIYLNAHDVKLALWEFSCWLRDSVKYESTDLDLKTLENVRNELIGHFEEIPGDYLR